MATLANALELYMLELINEERTSRGLSALLLETNLNQSAEDHSEWMLETDIFSHTGEGGSTATQRIGAEFDLSGSWRTAENLAVQSERGEAGYLDDVEDLHTSLMNSDGHRANLLNPDLEYVGIGIEVGNFTYDSGVTLESVIVTQNFAATQGSVDLDPGDSDPAPVDDDPTDDSADPVINVSGNAALQSALATAEGGETLVIASTSNAGYVVDLSAADAGVALFTEAPADIADDAVALVFAGSDGHDTLIGGDEDDSLLGGGGIDRLAGGAGADVFVFQTGTKLDIVYDFENGTDLIELRDISAAEITISSYRESDTLITLGADRMILRDVDHTVITSDDFAIA